MPYPEKPLFGFQEFALFGGALAVRDTLGFQLGFIRLPLLHLSDLVRLTLLELFALATLVLLDLLFLPFGDEPCLQKLVTQVLHRPPLL
jgi:hypothetical protein